MANYLREDYEYRFGDISFKYYYRPAWAAFYLVGEIKDKLKFSFKFDSYEFMDPYTFCDFLVYEYSLYNSELWC